ncbi:MAG: hypothetical protein L0Y58_04820 [Verrucomicrobia subdivision 3 bacterium]|nr:hypothetical protein [Limisphaerales bacterium]
MTYYDDYRELSLNAPRIVVFVIVTILGVLLLLAVIWAPFFKQLWSFGNIERKAKRVITGAELQSWATNLLASTNTIAIWKVSNLGTNFLPPQLLGVWHRPPYIFIYEPEGDRPGSVRLTWGGGLIGHCGFEIGPTNFVRYGAREWQPGVYFWSDQSSPARRR